MPILKKTGVTWKEKVRREGIKQYKASGTGRLTVRELRLPMTFGEGIGSVEVGLGHRTSTNMTVRRSSTATDMSPNMSISLPW